MKLTLQVIRFLAYTQLWKSTSTDFMRSAHELRMTAACLVVLLACMATLTAVFILCLYCHHYRLLLVTL